MKNPKPLVILAVMATLTVFSQSVDNTTQSDTPTPQWLLAFIPIIVPLLIALGKNVIPKIPTWLLPILAPALGALIDYLSSLATGGHASPLVAAAAGSCGVGLRELIDQIKSRLINGPKPVTGIGLL